MPCGAWAGELDAAGLPAPADVVDLAEQDFLDCWDPQTDECGGALPSWYADRAICQGVANERDMPYVARDGNACNAAVSRDKLGLRSWFRVPTTERALKQAVFKGPVAVAIRGSADAFAFYRGGVIPCGAPDDLINYVDHAVTIIGWDATSCIAKNSWGTGWGEAGFVRLASGCAAKGNSSLGMLSEGGYNVGVRF